MIKTLIALFVLAGPAVLPASALAPVPARKSYAMPSDLAGNPDAHQKWTPGSVKAWSKNSTCQLMFSGAGKITRVNAFGDPGDNVILFDANALGTLSNASPDTTKMLAKFSADTAKEGAEKQLPAPISFASGVVMCPSTAKSDGAVEAILTKQ